MQVADIGAGDLSVGTDGGAAVKWTKPFFTDHLTMVLKQYHLKDKYSGIKLIFSPLE